MQHVHKQEMVFSLEEWQVIWLEKKCAEAANASQQYI